MDAADRYMALFWPKVSEVTSLWIGRTQRGFFCTWAVSIWAAAAISTPLERIRHLYPLMHLLIRRLIRQLMLMHQVRLMLQRPLTRRRRVLMISCASCVLAEACLAALLTLRCRCQGWKDCLAGLKPDDANVPGPGCNKTAHLLVLGAC